LRQRLLRIDKILLPLPLLLQKLHSVTDFAKIMVAAENLTQAT
jgi:hypothetical protein